MYLSPKHLVVKLKAMGIIVRTMVLACRRFITDLGNELKTNHLEYITEAYMT